MALTPYDFGDIHELPDYSSGSDRSSFVLELGNDNFWRELAVYAVAMTSTVRVHLQLVNRSTFALSDCKLEFVVDEESSVDAVLKAGRDLPSGPRRERFIAQNLHNFMAEQAAEKVFYVTRQPMDMCTLRVDKLLPGETFTSKDFLAIEPSGSGSLKLSARLLATELKRPMEMSAEFELKVEPQAADFALLKSFVRKS